MSIATEYGIPTEDFSCPGCGNAYGCKNRKICKKCEECSKCCNCKDKEFITAQQFAEKMFEE